MRAVGIVIKNGVVDDEPDKTVESLRVNPELATKSIWTMDLPVIKKEEL